MSRRWFPIAVALVMIAGAITGFAGAGASLPFEDHEVYVARSAEEMLQRGEWLVPYFNDTPRLKKPPLNYWLVMIVDEAGGGDGRISELEARLPSILGGMALVALTIGLGCVIGTRSIGLLAGIIVATSSGYITYTHSARPEMTYAAFCAAAILAFALAERWFDRDSLRSRARILALLGWILLGIAMLAKGPQLPLIILVGWLVGAAMRRRFRPALRAMQPLIGVPVFLVISLWWFAAVFYTLPDAGEIWQHETLERYAESDESWLKLLIPYYIYRPAGLILPWLVLYPLALATPWLAPPDHQSPGRRRMWWLLVAGMVILSFSFGRRWYYMLPLLSPLAVLMAAIAMQWCERWSHQRRRWAWPMVLAAHVAAVAVACIVLIHSRLDPAQIAAPLTIVIIAAGAGLIAIALPAVRRAAGAVWLALIAGCAMVVMYAGVEAGSAFWRPNRLERKTFARDIAQLVEPDEPLLGWQAEWANEQYYLHRTIPTFIDIAALEAEIRERGGAFILVDSDFAPPDFSESIATEVLLRQTHDDNDERIQLWRCDPIPDSSRDAATDMS